jgi:hypothetical protein
LEFVKFAYERENMLLHIFRLEAKASAEAAGDKSIGRKSRGAWPRRVEDIIGKGSGFGGKDAGYAADGTLAARCFAGLEKYIRGTRVEDPGWCWAKLGLPRCK